MAVSVVSFSQVSDWFSTTTPKSVGSLSWSSGDVIVVVGCAENGNQTIGTPTNANLTFSLQASITAGGGNESPAWLWTATAGSSQTGQTVQAARTAGSSEFGFGVWVLTGTSGSVANATANQTESGITITPTAGSGVVYGLADWNADAASQTLATGTGTGTERRDAGNGSTYGQYLGEWVGVTATSTTFGVTSYTGLKVSHVLLEILASGGGSITGTVAVTQANQTSAASGVIEITGTVTRTQANQTSTASGTLGYSGTSARTQDNQTSTASGVLGYTGTSAVTQANQTSTASGTTGSGVIGTLTETQDNQTSSATGVLGYTGTATPSQANQTSTATGVLGYTGTSARTQANQTAAASGWITITGTVARTQANQTSAASGTVPGAAFELRVLPLYSTRTHGADGYHTGENQTVWLPTNLVRGAPLLVVCHGAGADALWYTESSHRYRPLEAVANTGMVVIAGDLGEPANSDGWGNDLSVARVWEVAEWAASEFECDTTRIHLRGESAGGPTALNAARDRPEQVASVHLEIGVCDIEAVYQGGAGNALLVAAINSAYATGGGWPAQRATHDPALNTADLVPLADRIRCYYTPGDTLILPQPTLDFCADVGCQAIPIGEMDHVDTVFPASWPADTAAWMWSLT